MSESLDHPHQPSDSQELHDSLVARFPEVSANRYGRDANEAAWWALAAEHVMQAFQDDYDDVDVQGRMAMIASGHESIEPLVRQHLHFVPAEIIAHLTLDGEPFALDRAIAAKFVGRTDADLIRAMERAEDFGYDDESYELDRRLKLGGLAWRWTTIDGRDRVEVYTPEGGEA